MGREIRKVPPNWQHPKQDSGRNDHHQPLYDEQYKAAADDWKRRFAEFYANGKDKEHDCEFWDWDDTPPKKEYYREYSDEEGTWFQAYETVSEGTPVSPPFATQQELADYLAANGDFWDQDRRRTGLSSMDCKPWGKENAQRFVFGGGYMPSMVVQDGKIFTGGELAGLMNKDSSRERETESGG